MNPTELWQALGLPGQPVELRPGMSEPMRAMIAALNDAPAVFTEREALKIVERPFANLKTAPPGDRVAFILEALTALSSDSPSFSFGAAMKGIAASLLRASDVRLGPAEAIRVVELVSRPQVAYPFKAVLTAVERAGMTPPLRDALLGMRAVVTEWHGRREMEEIHERIDALLQEGNGGQAPPRVEPAAAWTREVFHEIDQSPSQAAWRELFLHARALTQSAASRKWQADAVTLAEAIGRGAVIEAAARWLALGPMPGASQLQVPEEDAEYQKGFIWTLGALGDTSIAPAIADFALACFRKIPMIGAVSHRVGNACVNALAAMPGLNAVTQLSRLALRVKYDVALRLIEKALAEAAARNHVSRDDLEAMSVPSCGLDRTGVRTEMLGDCVAKLAIERRAAVLEWSREGKPLKSVPAAAKVDHPAEVAELKRAAKELDAVLATQRLRLERQLLSQPSSPFERWKAWYIDHPVTPVFARDLIWEIGPESQSAIWRENRFVDWAGNTVDAAPDAAVKLWHPIRADVQTVLSWRCWLEDHGVCQPFKQAHREVYLLTEAERETATYSNRFAAHIVRQHQFAALCRERGWRFNLMGQWDSHNTPSLDLPAHRLRAEFQVDFPPSSEISGHAVYLTLSTGRLQFVGEAPLRLEEVSPLVLSEVMRDVDLLVGVTSIGSDPAWGTGQPGGGSGNGHRDYWTQFAFGALSTAAENRRAVLEILLPKLAIRGQCRLEGRFLVVRGELHEYRIHLGSGNIIMEPGSRYLCIVQGAGDTAANLPLPFEGDRMLAIILSKALLLANDKAIKDETIRRQL